MAPTQLTASQIAFFQQNGYLVLRQEEHGLVDAATLHKWTDEVRTWPEVRGKWMPYNEISPNGHRQIMRTENFVDFHDGYEKLLLGDDLAQILKQLSGDVMLLFKDKINYKLPGSNGFVPHIDAPAYSHIAPITHLTANIAVDAATQANGYLEVVAGSHNMSVGLSHGGAISKAWEESHPWTAVPLQPGDMLLFGSMLAHRSGPNQTAASRNSVYATYYARKEGLDLRRRYYEDRRRHFPPDFERDPEKDYGEGWKRYAFAAPFTKTQEGNPVPGPAAAVVV